MAGVGESEDQRLLDDLAHIVWIAAPDGAAQYLNRYGREFLGLAADQAHTKAWLALVHPDDAPRVRKLWQDADRSGESYEIEYRLKRSDGVYRWIVELGVPQRTPDGALRRWVGTCTDVEEQKRSLKALRDSEERYRRLFDNALSGFALCEMVMDAAGQPIDFVYLEVNSEFERLTRLVADDVLGRRASLVMPAIRKTGLIEKCGEVASSGVPARFEIRLPGPGRCYDIAALPSGPGRFAANFTDLTGRKEAERALEQERILSETLLASIPGIVCLIDRGGHLVRWNRDYEALVGHSGEELLGSDALRPLVEEDRPRLMQKIQSLFEHGGLDHAEVRLRTAAGEVRDYMFSGQRVEIAGERYLVGTGLDVTERKRIEIALQQAKDFAESVIETANVIYLQLDAAGVVCNFNSAAQEITGYSRAELQGRNWFEALVPRDRYPDVWKEFLRITTQGEAPEVFENPILTKQGEERRILWKNSILREKGRTVGTISFGIDVTERRRAQEQEARLSHVVEQSAESIVITDPQGCIVYVNPAFERVSGYASSEAIGQNPRILKSGHQDASFYRRMWETLSRGEVWHGRLVNRRKDGTIFEEDATIGPVRDNAGRTVSYVAVKRDITKEMRLERQLLQAQKMEAVGRLAGGVAHDFNNLLGVITGYAEITQGRLPAADPLRGKVEQILKAAERAASLTRQLLAFSRQQVLQPKILDLNGVVADMEKMLRRLIGEDVELGTVLAPGLGSVKADPGQLEQVIMNLAVNARDAMPRGGRLTIETRNVDVSAEEASAPQPPGRYVLLAITDTGEGMDAETQAQIFEPFFTTKELGKGTGLGLSTVYGIVKQSEGFIWVDSKVDVGTGFKIYLPRLDDDAVPMRKAAAAEDAARGNETVLLIEDEPSLREVLTEILEAGGYVLLVARDGAEALQIADQYARPIHLAVTDVIMPGMTGRETMEQLAPTRPGMKILYVSGYTDEAIVNHGVLTQGAAFMSKPFTADELLGKVREVLDTRADG